MCSEALRNAEDGIFEQRAGQVIGFARSTRALYDEAKKKGWTFIRMKHDLQDIFQFEKK